MRGIKHIYILVILLLLATCSDDEQITYTDNSGRFVRFHLQVNSNNEVLEAPGINNNTPAVSQYTKDNYRILKIPVALTASLQENVTVNFSSEITNLQNIDIFPSNTLEFTPTKLVDTIRVTFNERWDLAQNPELNFKLINVSDNTINLGMPNSQTPNNELIIDFTEVDLTYQFRSPSSVDIVGSINEEVTIDIEFPQGYFRADIENIELLNELSSNFNYSIERLPLDNNNLVSYTFTVKEDIAIDDLQFLTLFDLNDIAGYALLPNNQFIILKERANISDNAINTASNFYDLEDPFYRTFGENWMDFNEDGVCSWQAFNAFTYPVVVPANHPNAVLYDDMGTADTSDDIYHHAFRIGFNSPNAGFTTNPFNLKRWFNNESSNADVSPGFNIPSALEFFPENGTSTTNGFVQIIEQDIIVSATSSTGGTTYTIKIFGSGTYQKINDNLYEIDLTLNAQNDALFGGTRTAKYKIYNNDSFEDPVDLSDSCFMPINL